MTLSLKLVPQKSHVWSGFTDGSAEKCFYSELLEVLEGWGVNFTLAFYSVLLKKV